MASRFAKITLADRKIVEISDRPIELAAGDEIHTVINIEDDSVQVGDISDVVFDKSAPPETPPAS
jgi:hypothetical protein